MEKVLKEDIDTLNIKFDKLVEPKEGDNGHIEQHIALVKQMRLMQLKMDIIAKWMAKLDEKFDKLEDTKIWIKTAYDVAISNLKNTFNTKV